MPPLRRRVEIYGDFQCPDTKATWDGWLSQFRVQHQHEASIIFHPFPLPYHKNGFDAAQAATVVTMLGGNFSRIADALFAGQAAFQTDATINMSQADVFKAILAPIAAKVGIKPSDFLPRMTNSDPSNEQVRGAWKLGAASGVSGTPAFAANGAISDELEGWDLDKWNAWMAAGVGKTL